MKILPNYLGRSVSEVPVFRIWCVLFVYTLVMSIAIHIFLRWNPLSLSWSVESGLLSPDSKMYHNMALELSKEISHYGWKAWELRPGLPPGQSMAAIASIFYTIVFPSPVVFFPLNAFIHASSGILLLCIINRFLSDWRLSLLSVLPFIVFPSAAFWYAQILKDGFSILGFLMVLSFWFFLAGDYNKKMDYFSLLRQCAVFFVGVGFIWLVRAYFLNIFQVLSIPIAIFVTIKIVKYWKFHDWLFRMICVVLIWVTLGGVTVYKYLDDTPDVVSQITTAGLKKEFSSAHTSVGHEQFFEEHESNEIIQLYGMIRGKIFLKIGALLDRRMGFVSDNERYKASSRIDTDVALTNFDEFIAYLPRAAQIVFLAPFPDQWFSEGSLPENSIMRRLAAVEMVIVYFALIFLPFAVAFWWKKIELWVCLFFSGSLMLLHGVVITNVGTLYRMRYGYLMVFVALGLAGVLEFCKRQNYFRHSK